MSSTWQHLRRNGTEVGMLRRFAELPRSANFLPVADDIKFLEMLRPWMELSTPKIDLTSFAHWSGTGLAVIGDLELLR